MSAEARSVLAAGAVLVACGIGCLIVSPLAVSCITWSDGRACETAGTVVLNIAGVVQIVAGLVLGSLGMAGRLRS